MDVYVKTCNWRKTLLHQKVCSCDWGKLFQLLLKDNAFISCCFIISIFKFCEAAIVKLPLFPHITDMGKLYFMYCGPSRIMTGRWWLYSKHKSAQVCGRQVLISMQSKNISVCSHHDQTALNSLTCKCEKTFLFVWLTHKATVQSQSFPLPNWAAEIKRRLTVEQCSSGAPSGQVVQQDWTIWIV